jgi:hypothetical protein
MSAPLRLAITSCGEIGRWMALFCKLNRRIRLVACCDNQRPVAEALYRSARSGQRETISF